MARRQARYMLVQALYQWHLSGASQHELQQQFAEQPQFAKADAEYFYQVLQAVITQAPSLDQHFQGFLDRSLAELNPIELTILRLATYELTVRLEIPYRVVINEALELAKLFGATDSFKYVNGVLDQVAKQWRSLEKDSGHETV